MSNQQIFSSKAAPRQFGDGLFGQYFEVANPKAGIVISTGIHQHSVLYEGFAERLQDEQFSVLAYDHRGFGQSADYPGHERSQIPVENWSEDSSGIITDLALAVDLLRAELNDCPVFVWGHSLGGLAAVILATSGINNADGFILSDPTVHGHFLGGNPEIHQQLIDRVAAGRGNEVPMLGDQGLLVDHGGIKGDYDGFMKGTCVLKNQHFMQFWMTDERIAPFVDLQMSFKTLYLLGAYVSIQRLRENFGKFEKPALILRGGEDTKTHEKGGTTDLIREAINAEICLRSYPGYGHDVIFDGCSSGNSMAPGENRVVDHIVGWLNEHSG